MNVRPETGGDPEEPSATIVHNDPRFCDTETYWTYEIDCGWLFAEDFMGSNFKFNAKTVSHWD
jgi:hypothetical protein